MKCTSIYAILFLLLIITPCTAQSKQRLKITNYTVDDGIAQKTISSILQSKDGYMWFSTWNGLSRYDGYTFVNFRKSADNNNNYIPKNNRVDYIRENSEGNLWCYTNDKRVYLFDVKKGNYIDILQPTEQQTSTNYVANSLYPLPKGVAWIVCNAGFAFRVTDAPNDDVYNVKMYSYSGGTLCGDSIYKVEQDSDGDEWILTNKGITVLGKKTVDIKTPFKFSHVYKEKILLATNYGKLSVYNSKTNKLQQINAPQTITYIKKIINIENGLFAIITNDGILTFDCKSDVLTHIQMSPIDKTTTIIDEFYDQNNGLWLITNQSFLFKVNLDKKVIQKVPFEDPNSTVVAYNHKCPVFVDGNKTVWTFTNENHQFVQYDAKTNTMRKSKNVSVDFQIDENWVKGTMFVDRQQNIWCPSITGLSKLTFQKEKIESIELDHNYDTRACYFDKNEQLWIGTKAGIIRIFDSNINLKGYLSPSGQIVNQKVKFSDSGIYSIYEDSKGNFWIGSRGNGLYLLRKDKKTNRFLIQNYKSSKSDPYSLSDNNIYSIFEDSKHRLWIGTYYGGINLIHHVDGGDISFYNSNNILKNYPLQDFSSVRFISESKSGVILAGSNGGLLSFSSDFTNPETIKFFKNQNETNISSSLRGNNVMHILQTKNGEIYATTFDGGINKITSKNLLSNQISFEPIKDNYNSTPLVLTESMIEDENGNLWIVTENSLARFNPITDRLDFFSRNWLIGNYYLTEGIPTQINNNRFVVATGDGMLIIRPNEMIPNFYIPPIAFTSINSQGDMVNENSNGQIVLSPNQRNLSINFAALDYVNANEILYAYRMVGLDTAWVFSEKIKSVNYANLQAGSYEFQVKSTNGEGIWVDNNKSLTIIVEPKFSETFWAFLLYLFFAMLLIVVIIFIVFYISGLRYKISFEQQLADIKLRYFTDISHELRTPLTLISGPVTEIIENEKLSPQAQSYMKIVESNVNRMLTLINQILDFRKIQKKKMKVTVEHVDLIPLIRKTMSDFYFIAEEKQITYSLKSSIEHLWCWIDIDKFEKIVLNLIGNAFKYTLSSKSITVKVEETSNEILIAVSDEGIGMDQKKIESVFQRFESNAMYNSNQPSSGIGLSLVKELSNLLHAKIEVKSVENKGSDFILHLRKGKEHFEQDPNVNFIHSGEKIAQQSSTDEPVNVDDINRFEFTILIVEDNVELMNFLISILSNTYNILSAENGNAGLKLAKEHLPDFILTDVVMEGMDGLEMIKQIKEDATISHIPVVILTSKSSLDDRIAGIEHGIDDYITKPFNATYLKTRIAMLIQQRKLLQQKYMNAINESRNNLDQLSPLEPQIASSNDVFVQQLMTFMEDNIDNTDLTVDDLALAMGLSRSLFYRKTKAILGISPVDFIRKIRIKRAIQLIESKEYNLSQIAYMTGFSDPNYFGKSFKKEIGVNPSDYKVE